MNPWMGILLVMALFCGTLAALHELAARRDTHPELLRKSFHIIMGMVALACPWLFRESWPVFVLAAASAFFLLSLRHSALLRRRFGGVVDGVQRKSLGELYFPLAIAAVFVLARGHIVLYSVPVLLLTLADSAAGLIGMFWGRMRYAAAEGHKSAEGSLACFLLAVLSIQIPLWLWSPTGPAECLLIGVVVGLVVTLIEAVSWRGLDNLLIPLGSFVLLKALLG
jgi:phytol kinase